MKNMPSSQVLMIIDVISVIEEAVMVLGDIVTVCGESLARIKL